MKLHQNIFLKIVYLTIPILALISCTIHSQQKKAESFKLKASKAIDNKEFSSAISLAKEALIKYTNIKDTTGVVASNYLIARASALTGDFDNAIIYGEKGSELCKTTQNYPMEFKLNNTLSWAYFTLGKSFEETLEHQKRQLFVVHQLNDDGAKAMVYNNYGYDATVSGIVPLKEAIKYSKLANDYYAKSEDNNGRWYTLMNLTWQHRLINDLPQSERYGRMAVKQAAIDNDRHAIIETNTNLGETLLAQNKIEEARSLYERGLILSKQKDDRDKYVFDLYYARYLWATGKKDEAVSLLKSSIDFLVKSEIFYEMLARAFLAQYYFLAGKFDEAAEQVEKFKNPRARYFSQESDIIAAAIEAQLVAATDPKRAISILDKKIDEVNISGAELLKNKLIQLKEQLN